MVLPRISTPSVCYVIEGTMNGVYTTKYGFNHKRFHKHMKVRKRILLYIIGVGVLVAAMAAPVISGRVYIGIKMPSDTVKIQRQVCTAQLIGQYNDVVTNVKTAYDAASLKKVENSIVKQSDYKNDATCVFMMASLATRLNDSSTLYDNASRYKTLIEAGQVPSMSLSDLVSPSVLTQQAQVMQPSTTGSGGSIGRG